MASSLLKSMQCFASTPKSAAAFAWGKVRPLSQAEADTNTWASTNPTLIKHEWVDAWDFSQLTGDEARRLFGEVDTVRYKVTAVRSPDIQLGHWLLCTDSLTGDEFVGTIERIDPLGNGSDCVYVNCGTNFPYSLTEAKT